MPYLPHAGNKLQCNRFYGQQFLTGVVGVVSGFAVIGAKKGVKPHRVLGRAFVIAMLCLGLSGAVVAWVRDIPLSLLNGLLIGYFVLTAYQAQAGGRQ